MGRKPDDATTPRVTLPDVARSSVWSLAGQGVTIAAAAMATPFTVRLLGSELFGLVALVHASVAYLGFADLGMSVASTRFGAQAYARRDGEEETAVVWTALAIGLVLSSAVAIMFILFAPLLVDQVIDIPKPLRSEAVLALRIAGLGFVARVVAGVLNTSLLVRLRWDLYTRVTMVIGVGQSVLVPVIVALGGGVVAAITVGVVSSVLAAVLHLVISIRLQPLLTRPRFRWDLARPLSRFGGALLLSSVAAVPLTTAERFFLARFGSVRAVGHYALAATLATPLAVAPNAISQPLIPAFTNMLSRKRPAEAQNLSKLAIQATLLTLMPVLLSLWLIIGPLLNVWVGSDVARQSLGPFYILSCGLLINSLAFVPANLIIAAGRADLVARLHLLELVPFLLAAGLLTAWFGAVGAALSWSFRVAADTGALFVMARRVAGIRLTAFGARRWAFIGSILLLFGPFLLSAQAGAPIVLRAAAVTFSMIAYVAWLTRRVLTDDERSAISGLLRRLRTRFRPQPTAVSDIPPTEF